MLVEYEAVLNEIPIVRGAIWRWWIDSWTMQPLAPIATPFIISFALT